MVKAEDMGNFYRIPSDNRNLNYSKYFFEGNKNISNVTDLNSHNTDQLGLVELKKILKKLPIIKDFK